MWNKKSSSKFGDSLAIVLGTIAWEKSSESFPETPPLVERSLARSRGLDVVQPDKEAVMVDGGWATVETREIAAGDRSTRGGSTRHRSLSMLITEANVNHDRPGAGRRSR